MSRFLSFFLFAIFFQYGHGQDSASRFAILVSPAFLSPKNLALQAGFSYPFGRNWAVLAEAAVPLFRPDRSVYKDVDTWRTGIELKRYRLQAKRQGVYYSLQTAYLFRTLEEGRGKVKRRDGNWFTYDAATLRSPVLSLAVKVGREFTSPKEKRWTDVFVGIGFRRLFNRHTLQNASIASNAEVLPDKFGWIYPAQGWRYDYALTRFHFTVGCRIGFKW